MKHPAEEFFNNKRICPITGESFWHCWSGKEPFDSCNSCCPNNSKNREKTMNKYFISEKELKDLLIKSEKWEACERGGVDNWEWFGESLSNYFGKNVDIDKKIEAIIGTTYYIAEEETIKTNSKYKNGDICFYNNNKSIFIMQLNEELALVVVESRQDFDEYNGSDWCFACKVGSNDGSHPSHTHSFANEIIDFFKEETPPNMLPLVVYSNLLRDKPLVVEKHENEINKLIQKKNELESLIQGWVTESITLRKEIEANKEIKDKLNSLGIINKEENNDQKRNN